MTSTRAPSSPTISDRPGLVRPSSAGERLAAFLADAALNVKRGTRDVPITTSYIATRGSGRTVHIEGVVTFLPKDPAPGTTVATDFRPHGIHNYLKILRNAYAEDPSTHRERLYHQLDFLLSRTVLRGNSRVWENNYGHADGMSQVEYAATFFSIASIAQKAGDDALATSCIRHGVEFLAAVEIPAGKRTGGIRTDGPSVGPPGQQIRAAFFHSRGPAGLDQPGTALNQSAHVLRDLAALAWTLGRWQGSWPKELPTPAALALRCEENVVAGLYQLAFAPKGKPPNMSQFMELRGESRCYTSFYEVDTTKTLPQARNISSLNTAHYHAHTLEVFDQLFAFLEDHPFDERVDDAIRVLTETRGADGSREAAGAPGSKNALYQWYLTSTTPALTAAAGADFVKKPVPPLPTLARLFGS